MAIDNAECIKLLHDHFVADFSQIENISKIKSVSR